MPRSTDNGFDDAELFDRVRAAARTLVDKPWTFEAKTEVASTLMACETHFGKRLGLPEYEA